MTDEPPQNYLIAAQGILLKYGGNLGNVDCPEFPSGKKKGIRALSSWMMNPSAHLLL
jgi:hypothetical protein